MMVECRDHPKTIEGAWREFRRRERSLERFVTRGDGEALPSFDEWSLKPIVDVIGKEPNSEREWAFFLITTVYFSQFSNYDYVRGMIETVEHLLGEDAEVFETLLWLGGPS